MLLVGAFPSALLAQKALDTSVESKILANSNLGEIILQEDFSKIENGGMPDGWIKNHPFNFLWAADKATGLGGDVVSVQNHKFAIRSGKGAHIVALPPLGTENYVFSATFQFKNVNGGSFGLVTDMADDYANSKYVTNNMMYPYEVKEGEFAQFIRLQGSGDVGRQNIDCSTGFFPGPLPSVDTDVIFTVYHLEGVTYFYCNGKFVSQMSDRNEKDATAPRTRIGMYSCGGSFLVSSVTVRKLLPKTLLERGLTTALTMGKPSIQCDGEACTLQIPVTLDKTDKNLNNGILSAPIFIIYLEDLLADTKLPPRFYESNTNSQNDKSQTVMIRFPNLRGDDLSRTYVVRACLVYTSSGRPVLRSTRQWRINPVVIANTSYRQSTEAQKKNMDTVFKNVKGYQGANIKQLTFAVFSDFHYKKGMYASTIADMQAILDRAVQSKSSFIIHGGDFCNDYKGSPELMNAYLKNNPHLPAYGIYGNHELETRGNVMQLVTPLLTNQLENVVWGTADGKLGDASIAYYYFEANGFRIICTDTNYSWNPAKKEWQHNIEASYGPPAGNSSGNSLGPVQLEWLEKVLMDAAEKGIPCIVFSHDSYSATWTSSPDTPKVRLIFQKANQRRPGTVLMAVNGHLHTNHQKIMDNILFWDVNTVFNGDWQGGQKEQHYADGMTFNFVDYDQSGQQKSSKMRNLNELWQAKNTWFFTDPLSAIVTIDSLGNISINGSETTWRYAVVPSNDGKNGCEPRITSGSYNVLE